VRNRRSRNKQMRRVRRALEEKCHRDEQLAIAPCENCGRGAGQMVMLGAVEDPSNERPYSGGWGCEECEEGLPGEIRVPDRVHAVRIVAAPSCEELRG
jgi:hypothetical protein